MLTTCIMMQGFQFPIEQKCLHGNIISIGCSLTLAITPIGEKIEVFQIWSYCISLESLFLAESFSDKNHDPRINRKAVRGL